MDQLETLKVVYAKARPLSEVTFEHYWVEAARKLKLGQFRLVMASDAARLDDRSYIKRFINDNRAVVIFPMTFMGILTGFAFRSLVSKEFVQFSTYTFSCYTSQKTYQEMKAGNVQWGTPLMFAESPVDAEMLANLYPVSFAYLRSAMSYNLCRLVAAVTDKVIICPDNDEAGVAACRPMKSKLNRFGVNVSFLTMPQPFNDAGDLIKAAIAGKSTKNAVTLLRHKLSTMLARIGG